MLPTATTVSKTVKSYELYLQQNKTEFVKSQNNISFAPLEPKNIDRPPK